MRYLSFPDTEQTFDELTQDRDFHIRMAELHVSSAEAFQTARLARRAAEKTARARYGTLLAAPLRDATEHAILQNELGGDPSTASTLDNDPPPLPVRR